MSGQEDENDAPFEIAVVLAKREREDGDECYDAVDVLVDEIRKAGLIVDRVVGLQHEFLKLAATLQVLGKAASELQLKKQTHIGVDVQFQWEETGAFVRQLDGSLFSWSERYQCYRHLIYGVENKSDSYIALKYESKELCWNTGESLVRKLETESIVKDVFPLHDEMKRKSLQRSWALNWWDFTEQPLNEIYSYFDSKIAVYFAFLGMYTRWLLFPAAFGLTIQLVDFGALQLLVLPAFFISIVTWAALFFQFWKRKNSALLARWKISHSVGPYPGYKIMDTEDIQIPLEKVKKKGRQLNEKELYQREEWSGRLMRFRNDTIIILCIICLQLPFELAYAHLYEKIMSDLLKFGLTALYLFSIQYFTRLASKISVNLIRKHEKSENTEYRARSLVYKVFGLYFMQSYIGLFYHILLHRNLRTLRQVLIQRLIVSQVIENLVETSLPYLKYSYRKFAAVRNKKTHDKGTAAGEKVSILRVEKDFLKPAYSASIGEGLDDGLFDDLLELALQFGLVMMFACAFPPAFAFAVLNNITEIRTDALKLLVMLRRPVPHASVTIGAWINIFQFLLVVSICTNSVLLACLYDQEGKWKVEPGLAAILIMEHLLLFIKFGFSRLVPEEPAWVRASRMKNAAEAQNRYSQQLLRSISGERKKD